MAPFSILIVEQTLNFNDSTKYYTEKEAQKFNDSIQFIDKELHNKVKVLISGTLVIVSIAALVSIFIGMTGIGIFIILLSYKTKIILINNNLIKKV